MVIQAGAAAAGMLEAERQFRRVIGYRDLAKLALAAERQLHRHPIQELPLLERHRGAS